MIIYKESDSFIWIFSYSDGQLGNGGVRISEGTLYLDKIIGYRLFQNSFEGIIPLGSITPVMH